MLSVSYSGAGCGLYRASRCAIKVLPQPGSPTITITILSPLTPPVASCGGTTCGTEASCDLTRCEGTWMSLLWERIVRLVVEAMHRNVVVLAAKATSGTA